jgi:hypothetical protein
MVTGPLETVDIGGMILKLISENTGWGGIDGINLAQEDICQ